MNILCFCSLQTSAEGRRLSPLVCPTQQEDEFCRDGRSGKRARSFKSASLRLNINIHRANLSKCLLHLCNVEILPRQRSVLACCLLSRFLSFQGISAVVCADETRLGKLAACSFFNVKNWSKKKKHVRGTFTLCPAVNDGKMFNFTKCISKIGLRCELSLTLMFSIDVVWVCGQRDAHVLLVISSEVTLKLLVLMTNDFVQI